MKKFSITFILTLALVLPALLCGCNAKYDFTDKDVSGYITLGEYKGLTVDDVDYVPEITEEDVEDDISAVLEKYSETAKLGESVINGIEVEIDSIAAVDGESFEAGTGANITITVGEGDFFSGEIDENILYAEEGATVDFEIVLPEDYEDAAYAGKTVDFSVTVLTVNDDAVYTVEDKDTANIDFSGVLKGETEPFEGGTGTDYDLEIGSGSFIEGFEAGLIGVAMGETVDLELTFPEDYQTEELKGKEVVFTVTVNSITRTIEAELTDELVSKNSEDFGDCTTADEYRTYVRDNLEKDRENQNRRNAYYALWQKVLENTTVIKYPSQVKSYYRDLYKYWRNVAAGSYSVSLKEYAERNGYESFAAYKDELMAEAESTIKEKLVVAAISQAENISLTDEEYDARLEGYYEYFKEAGYNMEYEDFAAFKEDLTNNGYFTYMAYSYDANYQLTTNEAKGPSVEQIKNSMLWDLIIEKISDGATINWAQ